MAAGIAKDNGFILFVLLVPFLLIPFKWCLHIVFWNVIIYRSRVARTARFGRVVRKGKTQNNTAYFKSPAENAERWRYPRRCENNSAEVRPLSDLWKALGFTVLVSGVTFSITAISDYERTKRNTRQFWSETFRMLQAPPRFSSENEVWSRLSNGQKCVLFLLGSNALVFCLWRVGFLRMFMWRWFTNSYASKSLCLPMILSAFSHSHWLHLTCNMFVAYSFFGGTVDKFLGIDQFAAFYVTAACVSSLTSLAHKAILRSPVKALGASGAILAVLAYTCVQVPDARLQLIFLPGFTFSAATGVVGLVLFDLFGLLLGFRLFDHAAHLGGTLFGIFYARYGENLLWKDFGDRVIKLYRKYVGDEK
ncbi:unnamed protein product [Enterobius vermicularis]|uniref:rhomboid protease n=1 Tax=Enterobius vermicularis TaxID=51028 RepID=A0A158Q9A0_ENTVE|nr:unnamed protein product [Enterobius vermicularis]